MIARYTRPEMAQIWKDRNRYLEWLRVEHEVCRELAQQKKIPEKDWRGLNRELLKLARAGGVDPKKVEEIEAVTRHDVIAFTTAVAQSVGPLSRYVHYGLTSSDVVDTALSLLIQNAGKLILSDMDLLLGSLKKRATQHKNLMTIGRSHGIFAEPTSFGLKFLGWYTEMHRARERIKQALEEARFGKLSGAVGANPHFGPQFEEKVLDRLGLKREWVSTQVLPRDRHAQVLHALASFGASMERICIELRHLQRSEVGEVLEGFQKGQKGSSAMPHKRNPISSENLTGIARLLRAYSQTGYENVALWHERDISHSSVERVTFPDAFILADYAIHRLVRLIEGLEVREERVAANLKLAGATVYSGHLLLTLVDRGVTREEGYRWIQACALAALDGHGEFADLLQKHPEITSRLKRDEIIKLSSPAHQLRHVDLIFKKAFQACKIR